MKRPRARRDGLIDLRELARFALREAHRSGADAADVSIARGKSIEVEFFRSGSKEQGFPSPPPPSGSPHVGTRPGAARSRGSPGDHDHGGRETLSSGPPSIETIITRREGVTATVRCFVKGGRGVHVCDGLERGDLAHAARAATSAARAAGPDPDFKALPEPEPAGTVAGLHDDWISGLSVKDAAGIARACAGRALEVAHDANVSGALSFVASEGAFANSLGVESVERATSAEADVMCVVRRDGKTGSYAEFDVGRRREDVELERVGELAARGALRYLGPRRIRGGDIPLVMGPLVAGALMESVALAACADSVQRGRSFLCPYGPYTRGGKKGRRVAVSVLTLDDDGRWPAGLHSSSRDGEGVPRRRLVIIEKGVFRNCLHNSYTAGKAGVKPTGHGSQLGGTSPTNLRPHVGTRPAAKIIADVKDGLYIDSVVLRPHPVTGEISATVDWAMKIEGGELAFPVTGIAVSGSVLEMLASLEEISSDYREEPGSVLPTLRFGKIHVVS